MTVVSKTDEGLAMCSLLIIGPGAAGAIEVRGHVHVGVACRVRKSRRERPCPICSSGPSYKEKPQRGQ